MPDETAEWPVRAYVEPIRSVLLVDDQFPTYAETQPYNPPRNEDGRARALWAAFRERGWLCDVDNTAEWTSKAQQKRLKSSDLLVLDYHLAGTDPTPALNIIASLAVSPSPDLVVVYTLEGDLDKALDHVASFARGIDNALVTADLGDVADLEGKIAWSSETLRAYLQGGDDWKRDFVRACKDNKLDPKANMEKGRALVEKALAVKFGAPRLDIPRRIESIGVVGSERWFQCGNLFVAVVGKPKAHDATNEAQTLLDGFEAAVRAWNPSWLACLIALSRRTINDGSFRDDLLLPSPYLQRGLLHYVKSAEDPEERGRRSRHVAADLLRRRFETATFELGEHVTNRVAQLTDGDKPSREALLHANAFLCAEPHERHHIRVGTVFRTEDSSVYWVCVTPACDMVPRPRKAKLDPWGFSLGDLRATTAVRLDLAVNLQTALEHAERGRYIFFEDFSTPASGPRAAAVFNITTDDPNPRVEQLLAKNLARKAHDNRIEILRVIRDGAGDVSFKLEPCVVVCQLRAPYAERLTHVVGAHLSRIGVDFLSASAGDAEE